MPAKYSLYLSWLPLPSSLTVNIERNTKMNEVFLTVIATRKLPSHKWPFSQAAPESAEPEGEQPACWQRQRLRKNHPHMGLYAPWTQEITAKSKSSFIYSAMDTLLIYIIKLFPVSSGKLQWFCKLKILGRWSSAPSQNPRWETTSIELRRPERLLCLLQLHGTALKPGLTINSRVSLSDRGSGAREKLNICRRWFQEQHTETHSKVSSIAQCWLSYKLAPCSSRICQLPFTSTSSPRRALGHHRPWILMGEHSDPSEVCRTPGNWWWWLDTNITTSPMMPPGSDT